MIRVLSVNTDVRCLSYYTNQSNITKKKYARYLHRAQPRRIRQNIILFAVVMAYPPERWRDQSQNNEFSPL